LTLAASGFLGFTGNSPKEAEFSGNQTLATCFFEQAGRELLQVATLLGMDYTYVRPV
jgi:hypothetical protein